MLIKKKKYRGTDQVPQSLLRVRLVQCCVELHCGTVWRQIFIKFIFFHVYYLKVIIRLLSLNLVLIC